MTAPTLELRRYDADTYTSVIPQLAQLYLDAYSEPPYNEGPDDVDEFLNSLPSRAGQPGFQLVVAYGAGRPVGFALGHQLAPDTKWWAGAVSELPDSVVTERSGPTFAIIEIAVLSTHRRQGIAHALHQALLVGRPEARVTLLVRPEAAPAQAAYARWGYVRVGSIRPGDDSPLYDAMVLELPLPSTPRHT
jgi:ribosomal protein S18 acetylase RimI-like enzyme